MMKQLEI